MSELSGRLRNVASYALPAGVRTALWFLKITLPISLGVEVLKYFGVVEWISGQLTPLFRVMGMQGEASLVFISAALGNLYTGLAVMVTVGIDYRSAIILAVMGLICHNLILETAIQRKSGASAIWMPVLRISVALLCGFMLNMVLPDRMAGQLHAGTAQLFHTTSFGDMLLAWVKTIAPLMLKMFAIIVTLNVLQGVLREFRILELLAWPLRPLMRIFGLPLSTSFLWIISNVIGLAYGGAALIDEVENGEATPEDARLLNTHIAISHSLLEDTSIFMLVGIPVFWLVVPRMMLAVTAVWVQRLGRKLFSRIK